MNDAELLASFEDCSLPLAEWTHRAHVRVAYLYLRSHSFVEALRRMRSGVRAYNAAHDIVDAATSGYNETTTHAMLHLIAATMAHHGASHPAANADSFCDRHPQLMTKHVLRLFYSPERRMDPRAKHEFVPPDLSALPRLPD